MQINTAFAQLAMRDPKIMRNICREYDRQSVDALRAIPRPEGARYVTKRVNGIWTIFDRWHYRNCEPNLRTKDNAERVLNGGQP